METKKCLIMCRTGMGSSMMLKIKVDKLIDKNGYPMDVTHDAFSGFAGQQNVDIIITMEDLIEEIKNSKAHVSGAKDMKDRNFLEGGQHKQH